MSLRKRKKQKFEPGPAIEIMDDGREICNLATLDGRIEYRMRVELMRKRQGMRCCLEGILPCCPGALSRREATFEHEDGRGAGGAWRDDRITKNGQPYNGAAHGICNSVKGSRRIEYNELLG